MLDDLAVSVKEQLCPPDFTDDVDIGVFIVLIISAFDSPTIVLSPYPFILILIGQGAALLSTEVIKKAIKCIASRQNYGIIREGINERVRGT